MNLLPTVEQYARIGRDDGSVGAQRETQAMSAFADADFGHELVDEMAPRGGFDFSLSRRNEFLVNQQQQQQHHHQHAQHLPHLQQQQQQQQHMGMGAGALGFKMPKPMSTGTTIVGVVYDKGIVLGADTRATAGPTVADKNCEKIHVIVPGSIYCCGAGTAADTEMTTAKISAQLELLKRRTNSQPRVVTCMTMLKRMLYRYQGNVSAALVLGGVDVTGPHLYTIYPHGSTDKLPFVTMGSGSLAAMSVFEAGYKDGMTEEEAKKLVRDAIAAGVFNDLGSGSNIDLCVIRCQPLEPDQKPVDFLRNYETPNEQGDLRRRIKKPEAANLKRGTTAVLSTTMTPLRERVDIEIV